MIEGERGRDGGQDTGSETAEDGDEGQQDEAEGERCAAQYVAFQAQPGGNGGKDGGRGVAEELDEPRGTTARSGGWEHRWSPPSRRIAGPAAKIRRARVMN